MERKPGVFLLKRWGAHLGGGRVVQVGDYGKFHSGLRTRQKTSTHDVSFLQTRDSGHGLDPKFLRRRREVRLRGRTSLWVSWSGNLNLVSEWVLFLVFMNQWRMQEFNPWLWLFHVPSCQLTDCWIFRPRG